MAPFHCQGKGLQAAARQSVEELLDGLLPVRTVCEHYPTYYSKGPCTTGRNGMGNGFLDLLVCYVVLCSKVSRSLPLQQYTALFSFLLLSLSMYKYKYEHISYIYIYDIYIYIYHTYIYIYIHISNVCIVRLVDGGRHRDRA